MKAKATRRIVSTAAALGAVLAVVAILHTDLGDSTRPIATNGKVDDVGSDPRRPRERSASTTDAQAPERARPPPRVDPTHRPPDAAPGDSHSGGIVAGAPSKAHEELPWIRGRVLDESGMPMPGIPVTATLRQRFDELSLETAGQVASVYRTWSNPFGEFSFVDLVDGEYVLSVEVLGPYAPATETVRAGVDSVELVLVRMRNLLISGIVRDDRGLPLENVSVSSLRARELAPSTTGADGYYELVMSAPRVPGGHILRYRAVGHRERLVSLLDVAPNDAGEVTLDVRLEPVGPSASVDGIIRDASGAPSAGETVHLFSSVSGAGYRAESDSGGRFSIPEVELGSGYRIWIRPTGPFRDLSEHDLVVGRGGLSLDITLSPLTGGAVSGRMLDAEGAPVPGFSLWLVSSGALTEPWLPVIGDAGGRFHVDGVPAGDLFFRTRSSPHMSMSGVRLEAHDREDLDLILDWGSHALRGNVVDALGASVPGARVRLSWHHDDSRVRSRSLRETIADAAGRFAFEQLGPGRHILRIDASRFERVQIPYDVGEGGTEIIVTLEQNSR